MSKNAECAVLAGGCYWIMQQLLRGLDGVISTRVGWMGGENENPTEKNNVGHAEVVEVIFDPDRLAYRDLLKYFLIVHRADLGEDVVSNYYRSEVFCTSEAQRAVADETIRALDGHWPGKMTTRVSQASRFWEEPADMQDYLQRFQAAAHSRQQSEQATAA